MRHFMPYYNFDLEVWPTFHKINPWLLFLNQKIFSPAQQCWRGYTSINAVIHCARVDGCVCPPHHFSLRTSSILQFFAPEPKAQVHYCDHGLSVRSSSVVVNFSHFRLLLWNHWSEYNETWQEARSQCPLPSLCFSGRSEKQNGRPGLWLAETFSTSPLKLLNRIQRNLTGSKI